jgi:hypothetical protein
MEVKYFRKKILTQKTQRKAQSTQRADNQANHLSDLCVPFVTSVLKTYM